MILGTFLGLIKPIPKCFELTVASKPPSPGCLAPRTPRTLGSRGFPRRRLRRLGPRGWHPWVPNYPLCKNGGVKTRCVICGEHMQVVMVVEARVRANAAVPGGVVPRNAQRDVSQGIRHQSHPTSE
jgi:hypothetical protein